MGDITMERGRYGELQSNGITGDEQQAMLDEIGNDELWLGDPDLARVTRLRLLSDPGFPYWDLSYCYGRRKSTGKLVRVHLPISQFRKGRLKAELVDMAKHAGVFAKGLGLLDEDVISGCM